MDNIKDFIKESLEYLDGLKVPALEEAKELFPHHPKAQDVWVKLESYSGGIEPVVETLGLQSDFEQYKKEFDRCIKNSLNESAIMQLEDFRQYCKDQVKENFYMFR